MSKSRVIVLAEKLNPALKEMRGLERAGNLLATVQILYFAPLAAAGVVLLILNSDLLSLRSAWPTLFLLLLVSLFLRRISFRIQLEIQPGALVYASGSLDELIFWAAAFLFGPTALWISALSQVGSAGIDVVRQRNRPERLSRLVDVLSGLATVLPAALLGLWLFTALGGRFPLATLDAPTLLAALVALLTGTIVPFIIALPVFIAVDRLPLLGEEAQLVTSRDIIYFSIFGSSLSAIAVPFAILAAALYTRVGPGSFLFFAAGIILVSLLAHRLSRTAEAESQRTREMTALEALGREIIASPPDASALPALLARHVPRMFPSAIRHIWLIENDTTLHSNHLQTGITVAQLNDLKQLTTSPPHAHQIVESIEIASEAGGTTRAHALLVPILDDTLVLQGGIVIARRPELGHVHAFQPAALALAAQIASALKRKTTYAQEIANERMSRELDIAGRIQSSFLPREIPAVSGWSIAARIVPARQTSGDFYDIIPLSENELGVVIADVADKGTGAALYMALSRTLIRTYAMQHIDSPAEALRRANERILTDTQSDQFVTVLYGVLQTQTGRFTFANAGHNPGLLLRQNGAPVEHLVRSGTPLGMFPGMQWQDQVVTFAHGDMLLLYTDGVTEAQDAADALYEEQRLLTVGYARRDQPAGAVADAIITSIESFVGPAPQFDDITLVVISRTMA